MFDAERGSRESEENPAGKEGQIEIPNSLAGVEVHKIVFQIAEKEKKEMAQAHFEEHGMPLEMKDQDFKKYGKDLDTLSLWATLGGLSIEDIDKTKVPEKEKGALRLINGLAEEKQSLEARVSLYEEVLKRNGLL